MLIVHVHVHVKKDKVEPFKNVSIENAQNSIQELGIARFDLIQDREDPTKFILVEVYHTTEDIMRHKETSHYQKWRDSVENMMAEPRKSIKYVNIFPDEHGWG